MNIFLTYALYESKTRYSFTTKNVYLNVKKENTVHINMSFVHNECNTYRTI